MSGDIGEWLLRPHPELRRLLHRCRRKLTDTCKTLKAIIRGLLSPSFTRHGPNSQTFRHRAMGPMDFDCCCAGVVAASAELRPNQATRSSFPKCDVILQYLAPFPVPANIGQRSAVSRLKGETQYSVGGK